MKNPYIFILTLFLSIATFGQKALEEAAFKNVNPEVALAKNFTSISGGHTKGNGTVVISFLLTKKGEIKNLYPTKFDVEKNGVNAILAIQKTSGLWSPASNDGFAIDKTYKIAFNFLPSSGTYVTDVKMADKFAEKKMYKRALKYYNKAIKYNKFEAALYLKRAEVKHALNDIKGLKADVLKCKEIQKEFLVSVQLSAK